MRGALKHVINFAEIAPTVIYFFIIVGSSEDYSYNTGTLIGTIVGALLITVLLLVVIVAVAFVLKRRRYVTQTA